MKKFKVTLTEKGNTSEMVLQAVSERAALSTAVYPTIIPSAYNMQAATAWLAHKDDSPINATIEETDDEL